MKRFSGFIRSVLLIKVSINPEIMTNIKLRRIAALFIDMAIISIMVFIFDKLFPTVILINDFDIPGVRLTLGIALFPVFYWCYFIFFDITKNGQSVGKSIFRILVVLENGEELNMRKRLRRSWYKMLGVLVLPQISLILFISDNHTIQDHHVRTITVG